ncbi:hypothetical protein PIROE2DRAFT_15111, partial [Piromyces sp. E2]
EAPVVEAPKSDNIIQPLIRLPLAVDYLFEQPKVEVTPREAPVVEAPKSDNIIQPLIRLPLAVDYLFEQPKVEVTPREAPVVEAPKSENIIQPLIRLPLAVDYLFEQPKVEVTPREILVDTTRDVSPVSVENTDSEVDRLKAIIAGLTSKLEQKQQSEANLNGRVATLTLLLNEANQKNRDLSKQYDEKVNNLLGKWAALNTQLAVVSLLSNEPKTNNKISDDCATINELMKEMNQSKISNDCATINELVKEVDQLKQQPVVAPVNNEVLMAKMAQINTQLAKVSLESNDEARNYRKLLNEKDQKIEKLQKSNARINGQLANLTLNVDETIRSLKNEPSNKIANDCATINELMKEMNQYKISNDCATINELMKEMEQLKQQPVVESTSREIVMDAPRSVVAPANNDALMAKMAQINTQLAKSNARINGQLANLTLNVDETIRNLKNEPSNKIANDCATINELMKEMNQSKISNDCATINELMKEMEQLKQQPVVESTSREIVMDAPRSVVAPANNDALMAKMAQINTQLAKVSLESNDEACNLRRTIKEKDQKIEKLQKSNARINGQLANLTLNVDETIRSLKNEPSNKIANDCATINELMKEMNQSKISNDCATINELVKEVDQLKQQSVVAPANNEALMAKMAQINTQLAKVSLESNDEARNYRKLLKENEEKLEKLQKSNARINGQLANLTLNVDETIRSLKNEPSNKIANDCATINELMKEMNQSKIANDCATINELMKEMNQSKIANDCATINELMKEMNQSKISNDCATINELMKEMEQLKQQPVVESTSREIVMDAPVYNNDNSDVLKAKMAQINTQLAKLSLDTNEEVQSLLKDNKEKANEVEKLRSKLGEINTQVAVLSLHASDMEKANIKLVKENIETVDSLRSKLAELNTRLAVVSLNSPSYVAPVESTTREVVVPEVQSSPRAVIDVAPVTSDMEESLRSKAADINTRLALVTLKYDDDVRALKNAEKEKDIIIEDLRNKAAKLNTNLAILTLDSNEESNCLREFAVEKQLERDALRSSASQLNGQLANLTLNLDEILRSNNAYLNEKAEEVDFLRQCTVQLNQQLAQLTLSFDDIIKSNNGYMTKQQDEINKLTEKTADLNGRLARLTLNYDEMNFENQKKIKQQAQEIEELKQQTAAHDRSVLTRDNSEISEDKIEELVTKINYLQKERSKINSNLARVTLQYDEDIAKKNKTIKNLKSKLNNTNIAYNNARRGSVVAKIQKIERLTDMSTNLNSNLARVTLEFNEMVQSKDAEINKLKDSLKNYEMGNQRRNSTITVEYNDVNYYNININAEKHSSKVMGSADIPATIMEAESTPEAAKVAPAAEPEIVEVKEEEVVEDDKKKKRGKRSKSVSKKIVKKSNKYGDLSIEQRKAMNKELVNQSCNIL